MKKKISTTSHWDNYNNLIDSYLLLVRDNPYYNELDTGFQKYKLSKIIEHLEDNYHKWINLLYSKNVITSEWINNLNSYFYEKPHKKILCKYIEDNINIGDNNKLLNLINKKNVDNINLIIDNNVKKTEFIPSELKFVTTTGDAKINTEMDFNFIYENFVPPENIVKENNISDEVIFNDNVIFKVVGCKTGNLPTKGFFKKKKKDFYNCATLNIVLNSNKCANVKIFKNGKIQLTGIPHPELGKKTVEIICSFIEGIYKKKHSSYQNKIEIDYYNTVMINTCYELFPNYPTIGINRDILHKMLINDYKLSSIFDSEGYPGVRIEYFYNIDTLKTENEGRCICSKKCNGKGNGKGDTNCRKISIAIFQSGCAIIAGGPSNITPVYAAYTFINNIIGLNINRVKKNGVKKKSNIKKNKKIFIKIKNITNYHLYKKIINI
jgi:hypothetical protein